MANILPTEKRIAVIAALAEGSCIRSIERMTGIHRDSIMRLGVKVGQGCARIFNEKVRNLDSDEIQIDELWGFIGKKQKNVIPDDKPELGDVWTFTALDADTKLIASYKVGKRTSETANAFVADLSSRLKNRIQLSSDGLAAYEQAVEQAFGCDVDYGQIVKAYEAPDTQQQRRYSPARLVSVTKHCIIGEPEENLISTSYNERANGTTRHHVKRLARLTLAFSKKLENFEAAVGLHFLYYNFAKRHGSLRMTPAMAAGISRDFWTVADIVEMTT